MEAENNSQELVDKKIYKKAAKRVAFKFHLAIYLCAMIVLWLIYYFVFKNFEAVDQILKVYAFLTALWTVIIVFHYIFVYKLNNSLLDKEIKKIQKEIEEKQAKLEELQKENQEDNQE